MMSDDAASDWNTLYQEYLRSEQELQEVLGMTANAEGRLETKRHGRPQEDIQSSPHGHSDLHPKSSQRPTGRQTKREENISSPSRSYLDDNRLPVLNNVEDSPLVGRSQHDVMLLRSSYAMERTQHPASPGPPARFSDGGVGNSYDTFFDLMHRNISPGRLALFPKHATTAEKIRRSLDVGGAGRGSMASKRDTSPGRSGTTEEKSWRPPLGGQRGVWRPGGSGISTTPATRSTSPPPGAYARSTSPPPLGYSQQPQRSISPSAARYAMPPSAQRPSAPKPSLHAKHLKAPGESSIRPWSRGSSQGDSGAMHRAGWSTGSSIGGSNLTSPSGSIRAAAVKKRPSLLDQHNNKGAWHPPAEGPGERRRTGSGSGVMAQAVVEIQEDGIQMLLDPHAFLDDEQAHRQLFFSPGAYKSFASQPDATGIDTLKTRSGQQVETAARSRPGDRHEERQIATYGTPARTRAPLEPSSAMSGLQRDGAGGLNASSRPEATAPRGASRRLDLGAADPTVSAPSAPAQHHLSQRAPVQHPPGGTILRYDTLPGGKVMTDIRQSPDPRASFRDMDPDEGRDLTGMMMPREGRRVLAPASEVPTPYDDLAGDKQHRLAPPLSQPKEEIASSSAGGVNPLLGSLSGMVDGYIDRRCNTETSLKTVRAQVVKDAIAKLLEEALAGKGPLAGPLGTAASGPSPQDVEPTANTAGRAILITAADPPVPEAIPAAFDTDEASIQSLTTESIDSRGSIEAHLEEELADLDLKLDHVHSTGPSRQSSPGVSPPSVLSLSNNTHASASLTLLTATSNMCEADDSQPFSRSLAEEDEMVIPQERSSFGIVSASLRQALFDGREVAGRRLSIGQAVESVDQAQSLSQGAVAESSSQPSNAAQKELNELPSVAGSKDLMTSAAADMEENSDCLQSPNVHAGQVPPDHVMPATSFPSSPYVPSPSFSLSLSPPESVSASPAPDLSAVDGQCALRASFDSLATVGSVISGRRVSNNDSFPDGDSDIPLSTPSALSPQLKTSQQQQQSLTPQIHPGPEFQEARRESHALGAKDVPAHPDLSHAEAPSQLSGGAFGSASPPLVPETTPADNPAPTDGSSTWVAALVAHALLPESSQDHVNIGVEAATSTSPTITQTSNTPLSQLVEALLTSPAKNQVSLDSSSPEPLADSVRMEGDSSADSEAVHSSPVVTRVRSSSPGVTLDRQSPSHEEGRTSSSGRREASKAIEPLLAEVRALKASLSKSLRQHPSSPLGGGPRIMSERESTELARLAELLDELQSRRQMLEADHGSHYSVARQLGSLHANLAKWLSTVKQHNVPPSGATRRVNPSSSPVEQSLSEDVTELGLKAQPANLSPEASLNSFATVGSVVSDKRVTNNDSASQLLPGTHSDLTLDPKRQSSPQVDSAGIRGSMHPSLGMWPSPAGTRAPAAAPKTSASKVSGITVPAPIPSPMVISPRPGPPPPLPAALPPGMTLMELAAQMNQRTMLMSQQQQQPAQPFDSAIQPGDPLTLSPGSGRQTNATGSPQQATNHGFGHHQGMSYASSGRAGDSALDQIKLAVGQKPPQGGDLGGKGEKKKKGSWAKIKALFKN